MKKFRLLSTLLATLMVISMLAAMPVGAADESGNSFFCDFESFPATGETAAATFVANGFKWMSVDDATLVEDATYGKVLTASDDFKLGFGLASPVTTGKIRLGFSFKANTFGDVYGAQTMGTTSSEPTGTKRFLHLRSTSSVIDASSSYGVTAQDITLTENEWYYMEVVVDLDNDTYSVYRNGVLMKSIDYEMTQLQGFYFSNGGDRVPYGVVDNVAVIYEDGKITEGTDKSVVTLCFPERLVSGTTASDVTITKCGSSDTVTVDSVNVSDNRLELTCAPDSFTKGCEYVIGFSNVKGVSGKTLDGVDYAYLPETEKKEIKTALIDFEDLTSGVDKYSNILVSNSYITDPTKPTGLSSTTVSADKVGKSGASGNAIKMSGLGQAWSRILDLITTDIGIETYEFDFKFTGTGWNGSNQLRIFRDDKATTGGQELFKGYASDTWKHMKIEYDTVKDELKIYEDGVLNITTTNFELNTKPRIYIYNDTVFEMDNYTSYVTTNPLNLKSVRYTDASGKVTGANTISPETNKIDLYFSEAINDTTVSGITLTAGGADVAVTKTVSGSKVTLEIPGMLPGNAAIALTVPTTVASNAGNVLSANRVYNVTTSAGKFKVSNLALKANGNIVTEGATTGAEGDNVVVTADVINTEATAKTVTVVYAYYNDDELVDVDYEVVNIGADEYVKPISENFVTEKNVQYDAVKAFIWDGLTTNKPLTVAASYPAE